VTLNRLPRRQAVAPWDEDTLRRGEHQLVAAEFLYRQGLPPQATYRFKHALIQDAAYQSLLKNTRQQHHQRIAQVLESRFPETVETQPELLAHHYTEAGLSARAVPYWQTAGQRSTHQEAVGHLTKGAEVLQTLPDTPERWPHQCPYGGGHDPAVSRPHHTISDVGLIGGGQVPMPGEVSLAHNGVLFLDELSQFSGYVLEAVPTPRRRYDDERPHTNRPGANSGGHHASMLCSGMHAGCQALNWNVKLCLSHSVGI
jgi:hypothetical protein